MVRILLTSLIATLLFWSCNNQPTTQNSATNPQPARPQVVVPEFNADSAYHFIEAQLAFGPRVPNSAAHDKCAAYLVQKLKSYLPSVIEQKGEVKGFDGTVLRFNNIVGSFNPSQNNRIFISSHWDSRPWADHDPDPKNRTKPVPAANDGASGVGVIIEIARQISLSHPEIGVDFILFDAEDYGPPEDKKIEEDHADWWGLGSQYWAKNPHVENYYARYGILLDMVGAPGATFLQEGFSLQYARDVVEKVWNSGNRIGYSAYFLFEKGNYINDDHLYVNKINGIPTIDIIHLDKTSEHSFYKTWHTVSDDISSIDKNTLKAVGQTLLTVIYEER